MNHVRRQNLPRALFALCCVATLFPSLSAQQRKNPTSKLYIANLEGLAEIDTGERIEELSPESVHNAQGTIIETKPDAANSMVFSNGMGVYLIQDSRLEVNRFVQEPFTPNRTDLETEPSMSQTAMQVSRGAVGICPARLVAGSSMVFASPIGSVSVRSGEMVFENDGDETRISLIKGDATARAGENDAGGELLRPGMQAVITARPGERPTMVIRPIPAETLPQIEEWASNACMARRTVYFDVDDDRDEGPNVFNRDPVDNTPDQEGERNRRTAGDTVDNLVVVPLIPVDPPGVNRTGDTVQQPTTPIRLGS